jgi:hypothetical protein
MISWCIIFSAIIKGRGEMNDLALLSIVSTFFARISLEGSVDSGFHEISELGSIARYFLKNGPPSTLDQIVPDSAVDLSTPWDSPHAPPDDILQMDSNFEEIWVEDPIPEEPNLTVSLGLLENADTNQYALLTPTSPAISSFRLVLRNLDRT